MASSNVARLATTAAVVGILSLSTVLPAAAQSSPTISICQATGSPANPWVFTTIDARDLPEHQAKGDYPAASIGDCPGARLVPTRPPANTPAPAPAQAGSVAHSSTAPAPVPVAGTTSLQPAATLAPAATATPVAAPTLATPVTPAAAATSATSATSAPSAQVAGVQATPEPTVSTLPRGGGEPDRPMLVLVLLAVAATGLGLRRLARPSR